MPTTQDLLDEANTALHKLQIGAATVSVSIGDRRIEYTPANVAKLESYIAKLQMQLAGKSVGRNRVRYGVPD